VSSSGSVSHKGRGRRPRDPSHGDWATTVALRSAKAAGMNPRAVAEIVSSRMAGHDDIAGVEIAGPGFINIFLKGEFLRGDLQ